MKNYQKNDDSAKKLGKIRLCENFGASFLYNTFFLILTLGCLERQFKPNFGKILTRYQNVPYFWML